MYETEKEKSKRLGRGRVNNVAITYSLKREKREKARGRGKFY